MEVQPISISTIISIISLLLLIISEILPFIKNTKARGIIHFIALIISKNISTPSELQPLLQEIEQETNTNTNTNTNIGSHEVIIDIPTVLNNTSDKILNKIELLNNKNIEIMDKLINNMENINLSFISYITDFKNTRQLKLQSTETYELNYIINYIKGKYIEKNLTIPYLYPSNKQLLKSEGYIVDYDSKEKTFSIKW